ncbi:hypothetical protein M501DRAFT_940678 [Patellaria atrata CBS 101060]|uniref:DUF8021 domain-containing protein n=1 Tax=Patellaria atrata CBS 101060 TaxID=1346257 RepID=A0A9P4S4E4_9PEZI|nr:hypothetical protein M501DRAFT_940678 [Patellaria atrata CBS 101060]
MVSGKALLLGVTLAASASAHCGRQTLKLATDAYISAQTNGRSTVLTNAFAAPNMTYTENDVPQNINTGVLMHPLNLAHNRSIIDAEECATFTELIVTDPSHPYVIGTRMVFANHGAKIVTIESIVTDKGDWAFNATGYMYWNSMETWDPIPAEKRDSRAVIKAAGDAYFNRWNDTSVEIPLGTPCARLEGGAYTGARNLTGNTCNLGGFPSNIVVTNRRYVVDEEMGVVVIFMGFPGLDRSVPQTPAPDSHMFRVQGGLVRYIHTVSACINDGCGMNGTGIPMRIKRRRTIRH